MTDMYDSDENSRTHQLTIIDNLITFQCNIYLPNNLNFLKYIHCPIWHKYGIEIFCIMIRIFIFNLYYNIECARLLPTSVL